MIRLYYFNEGNNFGDNLSPMLVEKLSGGPVRAASPFDADMSAVGSVFFSGYGLLRAWNSFESFRDFASCLKQKFFYVRRDPMKVWGSGFLRMPSRESFGIWRILQRKLALHALRGRFTHDILKRLGVVSKSDTVVYGDPGLLYDQLLEHRAEKKYDIGLVPHYKDKERIGGVERALRIAGYRVKVIDVLSADSIAVLSEISACETILSSSLHGCIVADSMGIPSRQVVFSLFGYSADDFFLKFRDYYSAMNMDLPEPFTSEFVMRNSAGIMKIIHGGYRVSMGSVEDIKGRLLDVFPVKSQSL